MKFIVIVMILLGINVGTMSFSTASEKDVTFTFHHNILKGLNALSIQESDYYPHKISQAKEYPLRLLVKNPLQEKQTFCDVGTFLKNGKITLREIKKKCQMTENVAVLDFEIYIPHDNDGRFLYPTGKIVGHCQKVDARQNQILVFQLSKEHPLLGLDCFCVSEKGCHIDENGLAQIKENMKAKNSEIANVEKNDEVKEVGETEGTKESFKNLVGFDVNFRLKYKAKRILKMKRNGRFVMKSMKNNYYKMYLKGQKNPETLADLTTKLNLLLETTSNLILDNYDCGLSKRLNSKVALEARVENIRGKEITILVRSMNQEKGIPEKILFEGACQDDKGFQLQEGLVTNLKEISDLTFSDRKIGGNIKFTQVGTKIEEVPEFLKVELDLENNAMDLQIKYKEKEGYHRF